MAFVDGTKVRKGSLVDRTSDRRLPVEASTPVDRATLSRLEKKFGGAGRLVAAARLRLVPVSVETGGAAMDVTAVSALDGLIKAFGAGG